MSRRHGQAYRGLIPGTQVHQPDDPTMRLAAKDRQLPEILVQGYEDPAFAMNMGQDFQVSGIRRPVTDPVRIMPGRVKDRSSASPDASVQEKLHRGLPRSKGSSRSLATTRRA